MPVAQLSLSQGASPHARARSCLCCCWAVTPPLSLLHPHLTVTLALMQSLFLFLLLALLLLLIQEAPPLLLPLHAQGVTRPVCRVARCRPQVCAGTLGQAAQWSVGPATAAPATRLHTNRGGSTQMSQYLAQPSAGSARADPLLGTWLQVHNQQQLLSASSHVLDSTDVSLSSL